MKTLVEFLRESRKKVQIEESNSSEKTFNFNFAELENGKETIESLVNNYDCCKSDGDILTITISKEKSECNDKALEVISQFCNTIKNSIKRSSNEHYAQLINKFEKTLGEVYDYIDELNNPEDTEDKKSKEEE